ncbi:MAG: phosphoglucosamine mutase [Bryobacteraceae bacterium]
MAKRLFGTDGIRGVAGSAPLDDPTVFSLGVALGTVARSLSSRPEVIIGMDTRESSPRIAAQVAGGLRHAGVAAQMAGLITTPGVAYLTNQLPVVAGVMISASHNHYRDNGIKVFGHSGFKLPDDEETAIEEEIFRQLAAGVPCDPSELPINQGLDEKYLVHLLNVVGGDSLFRGRRVVLDCGNGAASFLAPELFRRAGAEVFVLNAEPDGFNINLECGALHPEGLQRAVVAHGADLGVAFDGDADRAIFVAGSGKAVDGDAVLLIGGRHLKSQNRLPGDLVVATVMSNLGLEKALESLGIRLTRTAVGDKYVLEEMIRSGATLGGEQSGHVIFREFATTGDGMLTALRVLEIVCQTGASLDDLASGMKVYPQQLVNVRVRERKALNEIPRVAAEIAACEEAMGGSGRVLVRFSGTEALARVMVEAENPDHVERYTRSIAAAIEHEIGLNSAAAIT